MMAYMCFLLVLLFISLHIACVAKSIKGTVVDESGLPAAFVNVVLLSDTTFIDGKVTDDKGAFSFENADAKANRIRISLVGYEEMLMPVIDDGKTMNVTLVPSSEMLNEVVVKASLPATRIKGNAMVTKVENSVLSTMGSANDVLKNVPMLTGKNGRFSVFGRGAAIIYINGRLVRNASEVGQIASSDIKEVQVISNPGAQYGAQTNAVIKIVTKKPVGEGFSLSAHTDNLINKGFVTSNQIDLKYRTGGFEVFGMAFLKQGKTYRDEHSFITSHSKPMLAMSSNASRPNVNTNVSGKIGFNYRFNSSHSIGAYYQNDRSRGHLFGQYLNNLYEDGALAESCVSDAKTWTKSLPQNSANAYYNGSIGKFTIDINADFMQTKGNAHSCIKETNQFSDDRDVTTFNTSRNRLFAEKATVEYRLPNGSVLVGEEYTNSRSRSAFENPKGILVSEETDVQEENIGFFAEYSQTFGNFSASAGARFEHVESEYYIDNVLVKDQSKEYSNLFPSTSIAYSSGDLSISLAYSSHTVRPSYSNLSSNYQYINSMLYERGNPSLVPSKQFVLSAQASWKFINLSAQYIRTKDGILSIYEPYADDKRINVFTMANMPEYKQLALLASASPTFGTFHPRLWLGMHKHWFGIEYAGEYKAMGSPLFTIQLSNTVTLPNDWYIEGSIWWRSRGDWTNWAYTRTVSSVDFRVYKMFLNKSLTVYLGVNDITNGQIFHGDLYSGNIKIQSNINSYGRNVELTVRYKINASRNRYKGTGAGKSERQRF